MIAVETHAASLLSWLSSLSLQATVLVGLALLLSLAVRRASPRLLHFIWLVVLLRLAIPLELSTPLGLLARDSTPPTPAEVVSTRGNPGLDRAPTVWAQTGSTEAAAGGLEQKLHDASIPSGPALWAAASWIAGVVALVGLVLVRARRARRLLGSASAAGRAIGFEVAELSRRLGIDPPRVKIADPEMRLPSPAAFGLLRPTILLPRELATDWSADEREPLLVHELAHLRRRDLWVNSLQLVVQTLYFFHPLVWFANRRLRIARELACDEDVARFYGAGSSRYARALLRAATGPARQHSSALAVTLATPRSLLGRRVQSLLTRRRSSPLRQWTMLTTVLVGSLVIVALAAARPTRSIPELELPVDRKEWLAFVQELQQAPRAREVAEVALIDQIRAGASDPERLEETLTMIRAPRSPLLGDPELRQAWEERLELLPHDLPTLRAAASFYTFEDRAEARSLLRRGWRIQPSSAYWPVELAHLEYLDRMMLRGAKRADASRRALDLLESARPLMDENQLYQRLAFFARAAYGAGEVADASQYAYQLLDEAERRAEGWNYGNAIHHGHTVLGLVALTRGDRDEAVRQLLLSGDTPGSPQLNSFGPSFKLAGELLDLGERDAVLKYLERCGAFWASSRGQLESWIAAASTGEPAPFRDTSY